MRNELESVSRLRTARVHAERSGGLEAIANPLPAGGMAGGLAAARHLYVVHHGSHVGQGFAGAGGGAGQHVPARQHDRQHRLLDACGHAEVDCCARAFNDTVSGVGDGWATPGRNILRVSSLLLVYKMLY